MKIQTFALLLTVSLTVTSTYASATHNALCDTVIMKDEVTVTAQFIEHHNDRTTVHFAGNPLAKNASAWDMLYRIPGAWGLTIEGRHIDKIYIDGRELQLPPAEWANYLQALDAAMIKSYEFATASDSKEKGTTNGSVLYINLIETTRTGARISVGLEESFRFLQERPTTMPTLNMVVGNDKFSSYTYFQHLRNGSEYLTQKDQRFYYNGNNDKLRYTRETTSDLDRNTFTVDQSFAYRIDERNLLEANFNGFFTPENMKWYTGKTTINETGLVFSDTSADTVRTQQHDINAYLAYTHKLDTSGSTMKASVEYSNYQLHSIRDDEQFYQPFHTHYLHTASNYIGHAISPAVDFVITPQGPLAYTAGVRYLYTYRNTDLVQQETAKADLLKCNDTHESIIAAYGNITGEWGRFYFKAGLRIEYCDGTYHYADNQHTTLREWTFLPSATLRFTENEQLGHSLSLLYSTAVWRPNAALLDPTTYKKDEFTYMAGNPDIRSAYTHSLQLQQTLWNELTIALSADWRLNNIEETFTPSATDARVYSYRPMNYGYNHRYNLSAYYDKTFFSIWHINVNASVGMLQEDSYNYGKQQSLSFGAALYTQVMLPRNWSVAAEGSFYRKGRELGFQPDDEYSCSASVTKSFCNDRVSLSLAFRDIYYNMAPFSRLYMDKYIQLTSDDIYLEQIVLTFRYRFDLGKKGITGSQIETSGSSKSRF